jgi:hypothetical protein
VTEHDEPTGVATQDAFEAVAERSAGCDRCESGAQQVAFRFVGG